MNKCDLVELTIEWYIDSIFLYLLCIIDIIMVIELLWPFSNEALIFCSGGSDVVDLENLLFEDSIRMIDLTNAACYDYVDDEIYCVSELMKMNLAKLRLFREYRIE